jgi:uncharacterized delta-60 repeat protein
MSNRRSHAGKNLRALLLLLLATLGCGANLALAQTPGTLDPTFTPIEEGGEVAAQPDGKILTISSNFSSPNAQFIVTRFNQDGTLDTTFGSGGRASVDVMSDAPRLPAENILVDSAGRIYVMGGSLVMSTAAGLSTYTSKTAIARFLPNGSVDTSFGSGGVIRHSFHVESDDPPQSHPLSAALFTDFALSTEGKLLLMGQDVLDNADPLLIVRLLDNGRLDTGFGSDGVATITFSPPNIAPIEMDVTIDGGIVVRAGGPVVIKLTAQGALDTAFGTGGRAPLSLAGYHLDVYDMMLQPDGMIVLAGSRYPTGVPGPDATLPETIVVRLTAAGVLDTSFGSGGFSVPTFTSAQQDYATHVALEPSGKILIAGTLQNPGGGEIPERGPYLIRLTPNGAVDAGFVQTLISQPYAGAVSLLVTQHGAYMGKVENLTIRTRRYFIDPAPRSGSLSTGQTPSISGFRIDARNTSGIEVDTARLPQVLGLNGTIFTQSTDVNATADIFVVAATSRGLYMRNTSGAFVPWNNQVSTLVPAYEDVTLTSSTHVPIYAGQLPFAGTYYLYVGYIRSDGGPLVYIDEPQALELTP